MGAGDYIGLIAQIAGNAAGQAASQTDKDTAMRLVQESTDAYGKIDVPKLQKLMLSQQGKSGLADIKDDPRYRDEQNAADAQLNDIISGGGLTLADRAAINKIRNASARTESAGRNAITQGMAARGTLDSGAQLAAQLQGNQQTANSLAQADEATAGQAQARAFQAIKERAQLAGQALDRSYNQKANAARAQDAINAGNTAILNTAARYNAGIPQQDFANQLDLANSRAGANSHLAAAISGRAKDTQDTAQGIGNMVATAAKNSNNSGNSGTEAPNSTDSNTYSGHEEGSADHSDALTSQATRPERQIVGYRPDGSPIYANEGSNF